MRHPSLRAARARLAGAAAALLLAACGGDDRAVPTAPTLRDVPAAPRAQGSVTPGACVTPTQLAQRVDAAFGAGSPDANSTQSKVNSLVRDVQGGDVAGARTRAFDIVEFVLRKNRQRPLPGGSAAVVSLVNGVFCYAGLAITITDPNDTFLIFPTDQAQTLVAANGQSGVRFDANPVSEPTLVTVTQIPASLYPVPGTGPLDTRLDQYPGFVEITKSSATNAPLTKPAVVAVCPGVPIPLDVLTRARLGHQKASGFEITQPGGPGFLACAPATASAAPGWARSLASTLAGALLPRELHAAAFGGGVTGTITEFSPFGIVDPEARAGGGVTGTITEFLRAPLGGDAVAADVAESVSPLGCTSVEAPIGTPLAQGCRPQVRVTTPLGRPLKDVPVTFAPAAGDNGSVAPFTPAGCGAFGPTAPTTTGPGGYARACWTLGLTPGTQSVVATPVIGGDVNSPEAYFVPAAVPFTATANPPSALVFTQQPAAGATVVAGTPIPYVVTAVDRNGTTVLGWNGSVSLGLNQFGFATGSTTASAVQGVATFAGLSITRAATGYVTTASATFFGTPASQAGNGFTMVPSAPTSLTIVQGNGLTLPAGSVATPAPTVAVTDAFQNPIAGATIGWQAGSTAGSATPATSTTDALGRASTTWTFGAGANELLATLPGTALEALFTGTGTTTLQTLNSCPLGGGKDPINAEGRTFAFWIPNPGANRTIRQVQLFMSSAGRVGGSTRNLPTEVELITQLGSFDPAVAPPTRTRATVFLRGNNSEDKPVTFTLAQPIVGANGRNAPPVMMQLRVVSNPDGSTVTYNSGPCPPGTNCTPPRGCEVTQVNSLTPFPAGTPYRRSVAIVVRGN